MSDNKSLFIPACPLVVMKDKIFVSTHKNWLVIDNKSLYIHTPSAVIMKGKSFAFSQQRYKVVGNRRKTSLQKPRSAFSIIIILRIFVSFGLFVFLFLYNKVVLPQGPGSLKVEG